MFALLSAIVGTITIFTSESWLLYIEMVLTYLLLLDVILRIAASGIDNYVNGDWNKFDLGIIFISVVSTGILGSTSISSLFKLVRLFRVEPLLKTFMQSDCLNMEFDML